MLKKLTAMLFVCLFSLTGCNLIYKQNVQQGNAIEQDKLDQLEMGMTMSQVAFLLGTPAIRDPFHQDRWDYIYTYARRGTNPVSRQVTLRFDDAVLVSMAGVSDEADGANAEAQAAEALTQTEPAVVDAAPDDAPQPLITPLDSPGSETLVQDTDASIDAAQEAAEVPEAEVAPAMSTEPVVEQAAPDLVFEAEPEDTAQGSQAVQQHADVSAVREFNNWIIQMGAFESLQNARNLANRMRNAGFGAAIYSQVVGGLGERFLVRSDPFDSKAEAERQLQQINQAFQLDGFLVPPSP